MLAQNFKTAETLGISDCEVEALIKVLRLLECDELIYVPYQKARKFKGTNGFNMSFGVSDEATQHCGSIGCIAGWARFLEPGVFMDLTSYPRAVND